MRWVVAAILVFIIAYTWINLLYRKPGRAFEPAHDLAERAAARRLLKLGYRRIPVSLEFPASAPEAFAAGSAFVADAAGGPGAELKGALAELPALPAHITAAAAPREVAAGADYRLYFRCAQSGLNMQISDAVLYHKGGRLSLLPDFEVIPGELLVRSNESGVLASFPVKGLAPGRYTLTVAGAIASKRWEFTVK